MRRCTMLIWALFWIGWLTVLISTFLINHFELFGLQQAWFNVSGREGRQARASAASVLPLDRAPDDVRFLPRLLGDPAHDGRATCCSPAGMSLYILIALRYEEHDLSNLFGDDYRRYRAGVGMLHAAIPARAAERRFARRR